MAQNKLQILLLTCIVSVSILNCKTRENESNQEEVENRIKSVESNLGGWVKIKDSTGWTLADRMKYHNVNAISICVVKDFKIDWAKAYGWADLADRKKATTSTLFQVGSISKSINALGVLKLAQEKKLDLYTDINEFLKSWKFPYDSLSKGKKISIANLLSHTAGLTQHGFPGYTFDDTIPSILDILDGCPPANHKAIRSLFEPSLKYKYSGGGTMISQMIIQDLTGQPYDEFMKQNILNVLGMDKSSYTQPPVKESYPFLATGYELDGQQVKGKYFISPEQAAAGLWSNPTEMAKFIIEIQLSLQGKSNKILSKEWTQKYLTPFVDSSTAMGVFLELIGGRPYFSHNGSERGSKAKYIGSMQNGYGAIVMVNSDNKTILNEIIASIALTYNWEGYIKSKSVVELAGGLLKNYAGTYTFEDETLTIKQIGNQLYLELDNKDVRIYFTSDEDFFIFELIAEMRFIKDNNGRVIGFNYKEEGFEIIAPKIK